MSSQYNNPGYKEITAEEIDKMEVTFTLRASNGKKYTYIKDDFTTPTWAGMLDNFPFTSTPPSGTAWLEVQANFLADGFQFVTDGTFGGTTQPRVLQRCDNYILWK